MYANVMKVKATAFTTHLIKKIRLKLRRVDVHPVEQRRAVGRQVDGGTCFAGEFRFLDYLLALAITFCGQYYRDLYLDVVTLLPQRNGSREPGDASADYDDV